MTKPIANINLVVKDIFLILSALPWHPHLALFVLFSSQTIHPIDNRRIAKDRTAPAEELT
jgi:hypothetical protein